MITFINLIDRLFVIQVKLEFFCQNFAQYKNITLNIQEIDTSSANNVSQFFCLHIKPFAP